jgi:iron complex transport system substrate-binding protein
MTPEAATPQRIVSLDYCADQFVLKLADRAQIAALSLHAADDYAYLRHEAEGLPRTPATLEAIVALQPDLVIRTYGGGFAITPQLERIGIKVVQLGFAEDFAAIADNLENAAGAFGHPERGTATAQAMRAVLEAPQAAQERRALYITPGGVTSGTGSLIDAVFTAAGLTNYIQTPGWPALPLERIAIDPPDLIVTAFFGSAYGRADTWSAGQHPVITDLLQTRPVVVLDAAQVACGAWFIADAAIALRAAP